VSEQRTYRNSKLREPATILRFADSDMGPQNYAKRRERPPQLLSAAHPDQGKAGRPLFTGWLSWAVRVPPRLGVPSPCRHLAGAAGEELFPVLESLVIVQDAERLLTPGEVALLFRVDPKTVTRWASAGRIGSIRTPGGHRRFRESEVRDLLTDLTADSSPSTA
jgi:excisionase family DNA binding protein